MISVVIPTWKRHELLLERALPSVLSQGVELEVVVVSDGPDPDLLIALTGRDPRIRPWWVPRPEYPTDPRARWHSQGVEAINFGINRAVGDHLLIMGDDDELAEGGLAALLAAPPSAVVYGASTVRQRDGSWLPHLPTLGDFYAFPAGAALIDRSRLGGIRLNPKAWLRGIPADRDFWERLHAAGLTFSRIPDTVFRYWPSTAYELTA